MKDSFIASKKFFDDQHFPKGFSRHGDFTIKEADILEKYGRTFQQLATGVLKPKTQIEKKFVQVVDGRKEPENEYEKAWIKYLNLINKAKKFHTLSGGKPQIDNVDDYVESED